MLNPSGPLRWQVLSYFISNMGWDGFEPPYSSRKRELQSRAIDHSANSPKTLISKKHKWGVMDSNHRIP